MRLLSADDNKETTENAVTVVLFPVYVYSVHPLFNKKKKLRLSSCVQNNQSNNALASGKPIISDTVCDKVGDIREDRQQTHTSNTEMVTYLKSYDMIYLLTAIGLSPGGRSTVHIYTQTIHSAIQNKQYTEQHNNFGRVRTVPRLG